MSQLFTDRLGLLGEAEYIGLLNKCLHGIERECLRVTTQGQLAQSSHPIRLGSALTHPKITTDYSEALLELITSAEADTAVTLSELQNTHCFVGQSLADELLWSSSMPCALPAEEDIPIARYGSSWAGQAKHIYRRGLAVRYGKTMQCIAGIHYNFSLPSELWPVLQGFDKDTGSVMAYQSSQYIGLIRNFRRYSWLLMYLFGASPALDASFLAHYPEHKLDQWDKDTFYLPYATSLRMSDLGYQSNAQAGLTPCYDELSSYIKSLSCAIRTPYAAYEKIGVKQGDEWLQLNTNILQIENEYYSSIRPKRVPRKDERPIEALQRAGIEYVEARCMDINPFLPLGIDEDVCYFLNSFLLYCALQESPLLVAGECERTTYNFLTTVKLGRKPQLRLKRGAGEVELLEWAGELLVGIGQAAQLLDRASGESKHSLAVKAQQAKLLDVSLLPSAQVLQSMEQQGVSFAGFSLAQSLAHHDYFNRQSLTGSLKEGFVQLAQDSLAKQAALEQADVGSLEQYIAEHINN